MGKIVEKANAYYFTQFQTDEGFIESKVKFKEWIAEIEAEFKGLVDCIKALEKQLKSIQDETCRTLGSYDQRLRRLDSRIHPLEQIVTPALLEKPVPTDRHGKPEGGLKKWDVISYENKNSKEKCIGVFSHCEKTEWHFPEGKICAHGSWQDKVCGGPLRSHQGFMPLDRVTFEFRPKFPEKR